MDYSKLRIFAGAICLLVLMLLCGCTHKVYVPVESSVVHTDTLRLFTARVDSFYLHDSTVIMQSGDTVRITRYRDRLRNRLRDGGRYGTLIKTVRGEGYVLAADVRSEVLPAGGSRHTS